MPKITVTLDDGTVVWERHGRDLGDLDQPLPSSVLIHELRAAVQQARQVETDRRPRSA